MTNGAERTEGRTAVLSDGYETVDPNQVLSVAPLMPYHEVADIGCGTGYFTVPLGKHLFDGKVYAIDSDTANLETLKKELERIRLTNVEPLEFDGEKLPLDDGALDGAFIAFRLSHTNDPKHLLSEALRVLRRGGWIAVLEWFKRPTSEGPPVEKRLDVADLRNVMQDVGFRAGSRHDLNNRQYMLIMRK